MRFVFALVLAVSATPALADLQCEMQHGRLVCDYSAALMADAQMSRPVDDAVNMSVMPASYSDANVYDRAADAADTANLCFYTPAEVAAGC